MIIDTHTHVWRPVPQHPDPAVTIVSPTSAVPIELLDQYLDEHGVDRAVLVQPMFPGEDNSYVADCAAARPKRFAAVCVVDPRRPDAPAQLTHWVKEGGCKGLRLRPRIPSEGEVFGALETYPLWERATELDVVVNVMGGPEHLAAVAQLATRFRDVPILLDHLAQPEIGKKPPPQELLNLSRFANVAVKVSGFYYYSQQDYPYADCHPLLRRLCESYGPRRLLWGSDFPHVLLKTGYRRNRMLLERVDLGLSAADRELIFGGNALRLYWGQG